jgi:hypothetical protein
VNRPFVISTKARNRKKAASSPRTQSADLRRDVQEAIGLVGWIVELSFDSDEPYFCEIYPKLSKPPTVSATRVWFVSAKRTEDRFGA